MLLILVTVLAFLLSAFFLLHSWASSPKAIERIPVSLGWPIVGESFSFLSGVSNPSGVYNFVRKRQQRYGKVFKTSAFGKIYCTCSSWEGSKQDVVSWKRWDGELEPLLYRTAGAGSFQPAPGHWRCA